MAFSGTGMLSICKTLVSIPRVAKRVNRADSNLKGTYTEHPALVSRERWLCTGGKLLAEVRGLMH